MLYNFIEFTILNENFYDDFKSSYFKLFDESDEDIKNTLGTLFKKIDDETDRLKNVNIFNDFLKTNQNTLSKKIDESQGIESINKLLSDNLKSIYFAIKSIQIKLDDEEFTDIFENAKDKNLENLMNMEEDKFSNAVNTYVDNYMIPQIKKLSGFDDETEQTQESKIFEAEEENINTQQNTNQENTSEEDNKEDDNKEEENNQKLESYKEKSKEWFDYIYGMVWKKLKSMKSKLNDNSQLNKNIDDISNLMKNSDNEEAKKHLLKKITTISKEDLDKVGDIVGMNKEETGEF